ncbi:MAG: hypothetical protein AAFX87_26840 [Bacteroidota bacterium]
MYSSKIVNLTNNQLVKKDKIKRGSLAFASAELMGILFTADDRGKHQEVKRLIKNLEEDGKKVEVLSFVPKKKENLDFVFDYFTDKDVSFLGKFTAEQVVKFVNRPFDFLYCIDMTTHPLTEKIMAMSKAKCRVGKYNEGKSKFFEMMMGSGNISSYHTLVDEMYRYTKVLI